MTGKVCSKCGVEKGSGEFRILNGKLRSWCMQCENVDRVKNIDKQRARYKKWLEKNNGENAMYQKDYHEKWDNEYYLKNKDDILKYRNEYRKINHVSILLKKKEYRELNKDKINEYNLLYYRKNKDIIAKKRRESYYMATSNTENVK